MSVRVAVIPAAGLGTRLLPATKAIPKEMLTVVDRPVIQYIVEAAVASGIELITIVTSQHKRALEDHFDSLFELEQRLLQAGKEESFRSIRRLQEMSRFVFVRQGEPLGNGHAVLVAQPVVGDRPFGMLWGDDMVFAEPPLLRQLIDVYDRFEAPVVAVQRVPRDGLSKYGVIAGEPVEERLWRVTDIVEKPEPAEAPSDLAAVVGYVLTPDIFVELEATPRGQGGEIWLVDAVRALAKKRAFYAWEFHGQRFDVGTKLDFVRANLELGLKDPELGPALRKLLPDLLRAGQPGL